MDSGVTDWLLLDLRRVDCLSFNFYGTDFILANSPFSIGGQSVTETLYDDETKPLYTGLIDFMFTQSFNPPLSETETETETETDIENEIEIKANSESKRETETDTDDDHDQLVSDVHFLYHHGDPLYIDAQAASSSTFLY
ncbi:unnamed protein product [Ambrosiozyma monospora]|uniref:Unnamed protein product n=1 Tax=Ambrosiozyma monospora TaxID=43982 RepID=A0ACB5TCE8_AMBMO|nr:unnamed protein product [Ambrosiozyma monospora]